MKNIEVLISIKAQNIAQQKRAGAIPQIVNKPNLDTFVLSGATDEELVYKLFVNVLATYIQATDGDFEKNWKMGKELIKEYGDYLTPK